MNMRIYVCACSICIHVCGTYIYVCVYYICMWDICVMCVYVWYMFVYISRIISGP